MTRGNAILEILDDNESALTPRQVYEYLIKRPEGYKWNIDPEEGKLGGFGSKKFWQADLADTMAPLVERGHLVKFTLPNTDNKVWYTITNEGKLAINPKHNLTLMRGRLRMYVERLTSSWNLEKPVDDEGNQKAVSRIEYYANIIPNGEVSLKHILHLTLAKSTLRFTNDPEHLHLPVILKNRIIDMDRYDDEFYIRKLRSTILREMSALIAVMGTILYNRGDRNASEQLKDVCKVYNFDYNELED